MHHCQNGELEVQCLDRRGVRVVDLLSAYQSTERMAIEGYVKYVCSPLSGVEGRGFFFPLGNIKKEKPSFHSQTFSTKGKHKKI